MPEPARARCEPLAAAPACVDVLAPPTYITARPELGARQRRAHNGARRRPSGWLWWLGNTQYRTPRTAS